MKSFSLQTKPESLDEKLSGLSGDDYQLILFFSSRNLLKDQDFSSKIKTAFPNAEVIGCSTSGEIGTDVDDDSVSLMGLAFERTTIKTTSVKIESAENSQAAGKQIAEDLMADDLKGVFVLSPGVNVNGSKLVLGLKNGLPSGVSITGGLAGDGLNFEETVTIHNDNIYQDHAVAFGIYGEHVQLHNQSKGGWKPFGPLRRVTKAQDNVLYELDNKPALELYKEYLGDKADELPSSGLLYPFAIMNEDDHNAVGLIRTILNIDEEAGSLILAGDMEAGQRVCLMHANTDELVAGAEEAAEQIAEDHSGETSDSAAICISCVGRKILMGDDTEEELDVIKETFEGTSIAGFYSYGEISHFKDTGEPELHNQTMTITHISEKIA